jgi:hypothetical protein
MLTLRQVLLCKLGHRRGGAQLERRNNRAGSAGEQAESSQALGRMLRDACMILSVLCICLVIHRL